MNSETSSEQTGKAILCKMHSVT